MLLLIYNKAIIISGSGNHPSPPNHPPLCAQTRQFVRTSVRQQHATVFSSQFQRSEGHGYVGVRHIISKLQFLRLFKTKGFGRAAGCDAPAVYYVTVYFCCQVKKRRIETWGYLTNLPFALLFYSFLTLASSDILPHTAHLSVR